MGAGKVTARHTSWQEKDGGVHTGGGGCNKVLVGWEGHDGAGEVGWARRG